MFVVIVVDVVVLLDTVIDNPMINTNTNPVQSFNARALYV